MNQDEVEELDGIAIIGMAGRFPGAASTKAFWQNLQNGVESIRFFTDEELVAAGIEPQQLQSPDYVKAKGMLDDIDRFDAGFFGMNAREAEIMDPQHRLFLECTKHALDDASLDPARFDGRIGVYVTSSLNSYMFQNLFPNRELVASVGFYQAMLGNDKDYLPTRISYEFDLTGPSVSIQTACSSSLVAVHFAVQSLLNGECDVALTGGVAVRVPQVSGYTYTPGGIHSPDGHCRTFDEQAQGTVSGNGLGMVVLKRLDEAVADGDAIYAVIKASAINNDGSTKIGYTAPSVQGQARVISEALELADITSDSIGYVEAHGTATPLGDPIELTALIQAFEAETNRTQYCGIGSVKSNIGHLDAAAGIAGLIKTSLMLDHKKLPPSLHYQSPNPKVDLQNSPFYVQDRLTNWERGATPRRAGVSSFGIGGTNAHLVLEEGPVRRASGPSRHRQLMLLSAKAQGSLDRMTETLATHLLEEPNSVLADVAYTLGLGRQQFAVRRAVVGTSAEEASKRLQAQIGQRAMHAFEAPCVVFLFPGQGAQHVQMGRELYEQENVFAKAIDHCSVILQPLLGLDLRELLYPTDERAAWAEQQLVLTRYAQPALFVIEYALAQLWMSWGIQPQGMVGHSVGEYVAACLASVFTLEEALELVARRGQWMYELEAGAMLSVALSEDQIQPFLRDGLSLAAVNGPQLCVVSGRFEHIEWLAEQLQAREISFSRLHTSHAFHSDMMDPMLEKFEAHLRTLRLQEPQIPYVSSLTGKYIQPNEATNPLYWRRQLREAVQFHKAILTLQQSESVFLEVGPGHTLGTLIKRTPSEGKHYVTIASLGHPQKIQPGFTYEALGRLWCTGVEIDWHAYYAGENRLRLRLPGYSFEDQRYWIDAAPLQPSAATPMQRKVQHAGHQRPELANEVVLPQNETEELLVGMWKELLGIETIGVTDDFFELGGHSLLATQLVARIRAQFQVEIDLRSLFDTPTIRTIAEQVHAEHAKSNKQAPAQDDAIALLLNEIKNMSDDEIKSLLEEEQKK